MSNLQIGKFATVSATVALLLNCWVASVAFANAEQEPCSEKHHKKEPKQSEHAKKLGHDWVKGRIVVKAPASTVWYSVHEERRSDPEK